MEKYCFGVDVGGTSVKLGMFDEIGTLIEKWEIKTRKEENGKYILPDIAEAIKEKQNEHDIADELVIGIGIGVPGPVSEDGLINEAVNLGWGTFNIIDEMYRLTGYEIAVANDANIAALGEMWRGGGCGFKDIVLVTLGTGVGGGIIVNRQIQSGAHGASGEIGHIHVNDEETKPCNCGSIGCLEQVASATGIARTAERFLKETKKETILKKVPNISAKTVFDAVKQGDEVAQEIAEVFGRFLGIALAGVSCSADPEAFVIGGGVSRAGEIILDYICKYYKKYAINACKETKFELAKLGNDAGIYGGARLILG